ncbi:MAG: MBL fold metallo-hydrolase [Armatimonadota bacterium]|jgi:ribonuclease BN (tRNA processing enzyme)
MSYIKFVGTAGARFVVARQVRASGGVWFSLAGANVLVDPGSGSLVKCLASRPKLDPSGLDAVILTHKHLDHSGDVNSILEAMTNGGRDRRGTLFAPHDAIGDEPVVFRYVREYVGRIEELHEGGSYEVGALRFSTPIRHRHTVDTYGLKFHLPELDISLIADTTFFPELVEAYRADVLIINSVLLEPALQPHIQHLCLNDARQLIGGIRPKIAILTHFGMAMIRSRPPELAEQLTAELGIETIAARDGMKFDLAEHGLIAAADAE